MHPLIMLAPLSLWDEGFGAWYPCFNPLMPLSLKRTIKFKLKMTGVSFHPPLQKRMWKRSLSMHLLKLLLEDSSVDNEDLDKYITLVFSIFSYYHLFCHMSSKLQKGANDARSNDVRHIKEELGDWLNIDFSPTVPFATRSRVGRGLQNDICSRLLSPIDHHWDDEQ
jgi:hypothetical protein